MSVVRCDGCDRMIDTDLDVDGRVEATGKDYCGVCREYVCLRCGEPNPDHEDRDGCRDPDCPEQGQ